MPKVIMLIGIICLTWVQALGQSTLLDIKISVRAEKQSIQKVLEQIEQELQITFSYFGGDSLLNKKITLVAENETLNNILDKVLLSNQMHYQVIGRQIVLKKSHLVDTKIAKENTKVSPSQFDNRLRIFPDTKELKLVSNSSLPSRTNNQDLPSQFRSSNNDKKIKLEKVQSKSHISSYNQYVELTHKDLAYDKERLSSNKKIRYIFLEPINNPLKVDQNIEKNSKSALDSLGQNLQLPPSEKMAYTLSSFQIALLPGISTHGIHPGEYINKVSLNLLAGYSAGNHTVEIGVLSNFNQQHVYGLQIGGLANVVGGNKFAGLSQSDKQQLKKLNNQSNVAGIQVSGLTNIIAGNMFGWQTTGGVNVVENSLQGFQVAGISNLVKTYSFGLQLAGISNVSMESIDGVQLSGLYNYTKGELHGIQLSAFNQAGFIEGRRSLLSSAHSGLQIGLINTAKRMNGFQVGLVNMGGNMAGTQIGLINIHRNKKGNGIPIGLLNITSQGHFVRLYTSELFLSNMEISTGSMRIQNIISVGYNPVPHLQTVSPAWSVGYSIGKLIKPSGQYFYNYDLGIAHINRSGRLEKDVSLLSKIRATAGYKIELRNVVFHVFGGLTYNAYISEGDRLNLAPGRLMMYSDKIGQKKLELWPGFVAGIHL